VKYDTGALPLGSAVRAKAQLDNLDLLKALGTCRQGGFGLDSLQPELGRCLRRLDSSSPGVILSAYSAFGTFGPYAVSHLLRRIYDKRDFPTFLKQAYRFNIYSEMRPEVEEALAWHSDKKLPDAEAWRRKFAKIHEQELLSHKAPPPTVNIEEELPDNANVVPQVFKLRPLATRLTKPSSHSESDLPDDPYIISQTARAKIEQANVAHRNTLQALKAHLGNLGRPVAESKLIDAYAVLSDGPAIFEVKSIAESNERDQIRHALSQLYEYRYLYSMTDASLWLVFSQQPSSQWYIDYLAEDRGVRIVWIEAGRLKGPSMNLLT